MLTLTMFLLAGFFCGTWYEYRVYEGKGFKNLHKIFFAGIISALFSFSIYVILISALIAFTPKSFTDSKRETITVIPRKVFLGAGCVQEVLLIYNGKDYCMNTISERLKKETLLQVPRDSFNLLDRNVERAEFFRIHRRHIYPAWMKWIVPTEVTSHPYLNDNTTYEASVPEKNFLFIK